MLRKQKRDKASNTKWNSLRKNGMKLGRADGRGAAYNPQQPSINLSRKETNHFFHFIQFMILFLLLG